MRPLQLPQSHKSPFLGNLTTSPLFHASGIVLLPNISLNMHIQRHGVSISSALSISAVTPSAPHASPLFIALMAASTSSIVDGSTQMSKSSTTGGISATFSGYGLLRILSKCSFQRASVSASFQRTLPSMSFTGTSLVLKPLFNILLLKRVLRSCVPAASSASSASLSTNFLLSSLIIHFTSRSSSEYFLLSWSRMRSDWVELITPLPCFYFLPGLPLYPFLLLFFKFKEILFHCLEKAFRKETFHFTMACY